MSGGPAHVYRIVTDAHQRFGDKSDRFISYANAAVAALADFTIHPTVINPTPFRPPANMGGFSRPIKPDLASGDVDFDIPAAPPLPPAFRPGGMPGVSVPDFSAAPPTLGYSARPAKPDAPMPNKPLIGALPNAPDEPTWTRPQEVTLASLKLPSMPDIQLPTYTARTPQAPALNINDNFSRFTPEQYVSALMAQIEQRVSTWMVGQEALPAAIEQAIFGRGRTRIERERAALEQQAYDDFAARGFSAPNGLITARLDRIRQDAQDKTAEFNRDAMLKSFDEALANMRLAVQQGIQLEGVKINLHIEMQKLELQSLGHLRDTAIALLNARVQIFNAEVQAAQLEAQVYKTRIDAELSKLEILRAQIEAEKLKGEINKQRVEIYKAQWEAVRSMAAWYSERVNAYKTQVEAAKLPIEIFTQEVQAYESIYNAYGKEVDAWRAEIDAEKSKVDVYKATADAYASRVQGVAAVGQVYNDRERIRVSQHELALRQYQMQLTRLDQLIKIQESELNARIQQDRAKVDIYRASADVEQAASAAYDRQMQSQIEASRIASTMSLEKARLTSQEAIALAGLKMEALKATSQIYSQLAASSMSAMNYGATINGGLSEQYSRSLSWSGEVKDHSGHGW